MRHIEAIAQDAFNGIHVPQTEQEAFIEAYGADVAKAYGITVQAPPPQEPKAPVEPPPPAAPKPAEPKPAVKPAPKPTTATPAPKEGKK